MTIHSAIEEFATHEGRLLVGGIPIDRLAARVGSTPFFAYDRRLIEARVARLRSMLPGSIRLAYAVKANPMPAVVNHLAGLVDGFDIASSRELQTALDAGMPACEVSFAGPGKTSAEIVQAVAAGAMIELESFHEAERVAAAGAHLGTRPRVAIRINPDFALRGSGMRMGGGSQQFGVDSECVPELMAQVAAADLDLLGFHVFAGSQNLDAGLISESQRQSVELVLRLADKAGGPVRHLNLGGGFGIPYFAKDRPLDLAQVGDGLAALIEARIGPQLPQARVTIELGRYIVGEAGVYITRVLDRKLSRGKSYIVVDGGMHHHLAASGNFGQAIRRNYPIAIANRMDAAAAEVATVVGCLCTPLDVLGDDVALPACEIGDFVAIFQSGAYGATASPTAFLGHPAPVECLV